MYNTSSSGVHCNGRSCDISITDGIRSYDHNTCCILERYCRIGENPVGDLVNVIYYDASKCEGESVDIDINDKIQSITFDGIRENDEPLSPTLDEDGRLLECCNPIDIIEYTLVTEGEEGFTNYIIEGMENDIEEKCNNAHDEFAREFSISKSQIIMDCKKDDKNRYVFNMKLISTKDNPINSEDIDTIVDAGLNIPSVGGITRPVINEKTNKMKYVILFVVLLIIGILGIIGINVYIL